MRDDGGAVAESQWASFAARVKTECAGFCDGGGPIVGARAPGRVDAMGGVVDYSGGTVLECTLAEATIAAVQARREPVMRLWSLGAGADHLAERLDVPLDALFPGGVPATLDAVRAALLSPPESRWAGYTAGCLYILALSGALDPERATGLNVVVEGGVPQGAGVASSAALEVATMAALCAHFGLDVDGVAMARLCQAVENRVVGAPCGIMDQVTAALGRAGHLLVLKCQPADVLGHQRIPAAWRLIGIDSHVKHSVGGVNYTRARVAASMGLKVLQAESGDSWGGYLSNMSLDEWRPWRDRVPETLTGTEFTARYGDLPDPVARLDAAETYQVRACAEHHLLENDRVRQFLALMNLAGESADEQILKEAGALMLEANRGYSERLLLGSPETDLLVGEAMRRGPERGIYGAKVTGGGSGGTVLLLCAGTEADLAVQEVRDEYALRTGITPRLMEGSTPGAVPFGARHIF